VLIKLIQKVFTQIIVSLKI